MLGRPVVAESRRIVERRLQRGVRHLGDHLAGRPEREHRREELPGLRLGRRAEGRGPDQPLPLQVLRHEVLRRAGQVDHAAAQLLRRAGCVQIAVGADDLWTGLGGPEQQPRGHHRQWPELERQRRRHSEVAAATVQRPEQLGVLGLVSRHLLTVRGDQFDRHQAVAGQAELPFQPSRPTTQREPGDARRRHPPAGGRQTMRLTRPVHVGPGGTTLDARQPRLRVDLHLPHPPQVDDDATLGHTCPCDAVAAAADGDLEPLLYAVPDRRGDIRGRPTLRDHRRLLVDHRVEHRSGFVVRRIAGPNYFSPEPHRT